MRICLVPGSMREKSTNLALLRTIVELAGLPAEPVLYAGMWTLPHFNPDDDHDPLPPPVADLRHTIHGCDALLFCVPEYAGALPGSFKNLLDWTIGDDQPGSIAGKRVAWINASPRGAADAHASLAKVLGYASATIVDDACLRIPVTGSMIGSNGLIDDSDVLERLRASITVLGKP